MYNASIYNHFRKKIKGLIHIKLIHFEIQRP
jgi:hypothetical protein